MVVIWTESKKIYTSRPEPKSTAHMEKRGPNDILPISFRESTATSLSETEN